MCNSCFGNIFNGSNWWIIILLILIGAFDNGCGCDNGCDNNWIWIILLFLLANNGCGCDC